MSTTTLTQEEHDTLREALEMASRYFNIRKESDHPINTDGWQRKEDKMRKALSILEVVRGREGDESDQDRYLKALKEIYHISPVGGDIEKHCIHALRINR